MDTERETYEIPESRDRGPQTGYTLIEILGVTALMIILVMATQAMMKFQKRFAIEETCVQRLKQLSRLEHTFRFSNDPTLNPEGTYATFFDLKNANLVPDFYEQSDERRHTVNAFIPYYRLEFMRNSKDDESEPDTFQYLIMAIPLRHTPELRTFYMQEDGEVYWKTWYRRQEGDLGPWRGR